MNNFQSPQVLTDLYRDLKDRRLLPLVLVLVVGLAVVPIALSSSSKKPVSSTASPPAPVAKKSGGPAVEVVAADPGLRDYRRRLAGEVPLDPFVQQFTTPGGTTDSAELTPTEGATAGESSGAVSPTTSSGTTTGSSGSEPVSSNESETQYIVYRLTARTGPTDDPLTELHKDVGVLEPLPNKDVPALSFLGVQADSQLKPKFAYFLVSTSVSALTGGNCVLGDPCQLLTLKPGQSVELIWVDGISYKVELVEFNTYTKDKSSASKKKSDSRKADAKRSQQARFSF